MLSASAREQVRVLSDEIIRIVKEDHDIQHPEGACWICGKHGRSKKSLRTLDGYVTPASIGLDNLILCMPHEISLTLSMDAPNYNTYHEGYPRTPEQLRIRFAYWLTKQLSKQAKLLKQTEEQNVE